MPDKTPGALLNEYCLVGGWVQISLRYLFQISLRYLFGYADHCLGGIYQSHHNSSETLLSFWGGAYPYLCGNTMIVMRSQNQIVLLSGTFLRAHV